MAKVQLVNVSGGAIPDELKKQIEEKIGTINDEQVLTADLAPDALGALLTQAFGGGVSEERDTEPLNAEEAMAMYLDPHVRWKPKLGDLVTLREEMACNFAYPKKGETCVVTQVMDPPLRSQNVSSSESGMCLNICVAFKQKHGNHHHYLEHTMDSRYFVKLGNIYEPKED
jgi:hypothetical protein